MVDIEKYGNFIESGTHENKTQIILCHTSRGVEEYLTSLNLRFNERYNKIPNYVVTREGRVLELLSETSYSNLFTNIDVNKNSIVISLENLGWLEKKPLKNYYINWKGSIYNEQVYEKKWRDFFFWQPYTNSQIEKTVNLCMQIAESRQIKKRFIGHNTKVDGVETFNGIVTRSNFDTKFTDLNPSFDFVNFTKKIENEQFAQ
jgi:hypothetical protein